MDLELIVDVLNHAIAAAEALDVDADERARWREMLNQLPPLQVGKHGQLQEWLEDYDESEPGHRHISHLYGLFPSEQFTPETRPELFAAARRSLERRLENSGGHTGWSRAWTVCCWARLGEGDLAREHLVHLVTDYATPAMLDLHPPACGHKRPVFQIEGNFGGAAGVMEMFLQSHGGTIRVLPALPSTWPDGSVEGLRARGGFIVNIRWAGGALQEVQIESLRGQPCRLRTPRPMKSVVTDDGAAVEFQRLEEKTILLTTETGRKYRIV
jgi:alpha-L-fucosidase 2